MLVLHKTNPYLTLPAFCIKKLNKTKLAGNCLDAFYYITSRVYCYPTGNKNCVEIIFIVEAYKL